MCVRAHMATDRSLGLQMGLKVPPVTDIDKKPSMSNLSIPQGPKERGMLKTESD